MKPENKDTILLLLLSIFISIILVIGTLVYFYITTPRGSVTGTLSGWSTKDYGDFCGQYPSTRISFSNYTQDGDECFENGYNEFYFFGYHPELNDFVNGSVIKVSYHQESRGADSDASKTIYYWVIDNIEYKVNGSGK